jgi:hypothetical protein
MKFLQSPALVLSVLLSSVIDKALGDFPDGCSFSLASPELHFTCGSHSGEQELDLCISNQDGQLTAGNESV